MLLRYPNLLTAGVLILSMGCIGASALSQPEDRAERAVTRVQTDDGGRCFNHCMAGRLFHQCQVDPEGKMQNCCSQACTRFSNRYGRRAD